VNYNSKYVVRLTKEERDELQGIMRRGKVAAAKRTRAQMLLKGGFGTSGRTDSPSHRSVNASRKSSAEGVCRRGAIGGDRTQAAVRTAAA
jgi:hypothetical protein